jgi:hypothetical protein
MIGSQYECEPSTYDGMYSMVRPLLFEAETPTTWEPEKDDAPEKAAAGEATRKAPAAIAKIDFILTSSRLLVS